MAASALPIPEHRIRRALSGPDAPLATTLLDLVRVVGEVTDDDREVVATIRYLLRTGRVVLCGSFRGSLLD
jgi:hypothetical protein